MGYSCMDCEYAKADFDLLMHRCTHKDMPVWFNVCVWEGRPACERFEKRSSELDVKQ